MSSLCLCNECVTNKSLSGICGSELNNSLWELLVEVEVVFEIVTEVIICLVLSALLCILLSQYC